MKYQVIVGDTEVCVTSLIREACQTFNSFSALSKNGIGEAADKPVTLLKQGHVMVEYMPQTHLIAMRRVRSVHSQLTTGGKTMITKREILLRHAESLEECIRDSLEVIEDYKRSKAPSTWIVEVEACMKDAQRQLAEVEEELKS
jgi:hypothetical protein